MRKPDPDRSVCWRVKLDSEVPASVRSAIEALAAGDTQAIGDAYATLQHEADQKVDWADAVWDKLITLLASPNNRVRSIAGQALCAFAASADHSKVSRDLGTILLTSHDERFVTARHILQSIWRIGLCSDALRHDLLIQLEQTFRNCTGEKNWTLIRFDIVCGLRELYDATGDKAVRDAAGGLIGLEDSEKYRKKYASAWRDI